MPPDRTTGKTTFLKLSSCDEKLPEKSASLEKEDEKIIHDMIGIWQEVVGGFVPTGSKALSMLRQALKNLFGDCLRSWRNYCRKIASSKFLMGEVSKFRAWFTWVIKPETYTRIMQDGFSFGDRDLPEAEARKIRQEEEQEKEEVFHGVGILVPSDQ